MLDPHRDYNQIVALNNSSFKHLERSPSHYRAWKDGLLDAKTTDAQNFGIAAHCAILEPERFADDYLCLPDTSSCITAAQKAVMTKAAKKDLESSNKFLLSFADYQAILHMRHSIYQHPFSKYLLEQGSREWTHTWTDAPSGAFCKCRTDLWLPQHGNLIADVKVCQNLSDEEFGRHVACYKIHRQAAFYSDGLQAEAFLIIGMERTPPYAVRVFIVPDFLIKIGRAMYQPLCQLYQECLTSNQWPGFSLKVTPLKMPAYAIPENLDLAA